MIHEAFATDPTPDLPLNVGFGSLADFRAQSGVSATFLRTDMLIAGIDVC